MVRRVLKAMLTAIEEVEMTDRKMRGVINEE
jgi:hypothetical protein